MAVNGVGDDPGPKPASTAADEKKNAPAYDHKKALEALQKAVRAARAKAAQSQAENQTPQVADSAAFRGGAVPVNQTGAGTAEAAEGPAQVQANANKGTQPPPGQDVSKTRSAATPIEEARQRLGGGFIDKVYGDIDKADRWVTSGIDSVRSDTPGVSQAASVFRGVAGFVKDLGFGVGRAAVMISPPGQADMAFRDAELGAKVANGEVTGRQVVDTAKAVGSAIVEPVTKPWNRGDRVEAGTRAVTEVASLFLPASKAGLFGKSGKAANVADKSNEVAKGTRLGEATKAEGTAGAEAKAKPPAASEQANAPGKADHGPLANALHQRSLGMDPATGLYRPSEAATATRLEQQLGRRLERDQTGHADWVDSAGRTYDAVGPVPQQYFDLNSFSKSITGHLLKQGLDRVVVDTTGMTNSQISQIKNFIGSLPQAQQQRIIGIGF